MNIQQAFIEICNNICFVHSCTVESKKLGMRFSITPFATGDSSLALEIDQQQTQKYYLNLN